MPNQPAVTIPAPDAELCLSFANTRYWRGSVAPTDELLAPADLLRWASTAERLPSELAGRFEGSDGLLADALALREAIYRCFAATARGGEPAAADLDVLNAALAEAPERRRVHRGGWQGWPVATSAVALLAPALWSAADLLAGGQLARVRQCANPQCGWLFLDNSKGGNRRWCSMSACGNRAKAHRHYLRQKENQAGC
jgi:predicted RNA-binding Zn ribbon-like protein